VEDLEALIKGGRRFSLCLRHSSGAVLALNAASTGSRSKSSHFTKRLSSSSAAGLRRQNDWAQIDAAVAEGRRGDALKVFLNQWESPRSPSP